MAKLVGDLCRGRLKIPSKIIKIPQFTKRVYRRSFTPNASTDDLSFQTLAMCVFRILWVIYGGMLFFSRFDVCQRLLEELYATEVDAIFGPYVRGKRRAESAVADQFGSSSVILHPVNGFDFVVCVVMCCQVLSAWPWSCSINDELCFWVPVRLKGYNMSQDDLLMQYEILYVFYLASLFVSLQPSHFHWGSPASFMAVKSSVQLRLVWLAGMERRLGTAGHNTVGPYTSIYCIVTYCRLFMDIYCHWWSLMVIDDDPWWLIILEQV